MTRINETSAEQRIADCARIAKDCQSLALSERHDIMPAVRETLAEAYGALDDMLAERRRLEGEREKLQAIISKLPRTADGVPIVPGMELHVIQKPLTRGDWWYRRMIAHSVRADYVGASGQEGGCRPEDCYSKRELATHEIEHNRKCPACGNALAATPPADAGKGDDATR